jgi:hypothetical protein
MEKGLLLDRVDRCGDGASVHEGIEDAFPVLADPTQTRFPRGDTAVVSAEEAMDPRATAPFFPEGRPRDT